MNEINHFAISSILNSEIVGRAKFGHGQIASLGDAQRFVDMLGVGESPSNVHQNESVDVEAVKRAFLAVRKARGDRGSPDLYVADPDRNAIFLAKCREIGIGASDYTINKTLFYARKNNYLPGLKSVRTSIDYEEFAFASEFAATELKYKTGATIDDIVCDPGLASQFDAIARKLAPGFSSFEYRWAILSIHKKQRRKLPPSFRMPAFTERFRLVADPLEQVPDTRGVYLLYVKQKLLYARSTERLRHGIELHRNPKLLRPIAETLWKPNPEDFIVSYAVLPEKKLLRPLEEKIVQEKQPIFNVPRSAA